MPGPDKKGQWPQLHVMFAHQEREERIAAKKKKEAEAKEAKCTDPDMVNFLERSSTLEATKTIQAAVRAMPPKKKQRTRSPSPWRAGPSWSRNSMGGPL